MSGIRRHTPADSYAILWDLFEKLDSVSESEGRGALWMALNAILRTPSHILERTVGSVVCAPTTKCVETGICELAGVGCDDLDEHASQCKDSLDAHATENVRRTLEYEREEWRKERDSLYREINRYRNHWMRLVMSNPPAEYSIPNLNDVVTTIIPMCGVCRAQERLHLDHVIPRSKGGPNHYANYQLLCGQCNSSKSNRDMDQWIEWVNTSDDSGARDIRHRREENHRAMWPDNLAKS